MRPCELLRQGRVISIRLLTNGVRIRWSRPVEQPDVVVIDCLEKVDLGPDTAASREATETRITPAKLRKPSIYYPVDPIDGPAARSYTQSRRNHSDIEDLPLTATTTATPTTPAPTTPPSRLPRQRGDRLQHEGRVRRPADGPARASCRQGSGQPGRDRRRGGPAPGVSRAARGQPARGRARRRAPAARTAATSSPARPRRSRWPRSCARSRARSRR